ncbi:uncharacterized protein MELLADRAFT_59454 [Melampsora larici-populina 98AG31]|uniref:Uncharacterized protein n=1 Tax=Melampsora larici-populina (strain 98AG31 / pathotype 3-4-7) TaxID=747676 RepID=F4R7J6_MELLP|nr:uncharacterized protein MELLADRAFT_59454 [Melampsora larici-populina 98AG31]EGG11327.1 hypothetical protein MELLADRAFT_59454 [Melampsora larici-populina 98AG31]
MLQNPVFADGVFAVVCVLPPTESFRPLLAGTCLAEASCMLSGVSGHSSHVMPLVMLYSQGDGPPLRAGHIYQASGRFAYDEISGKILLAVTPTRLTDLGPTSDTHGQLPPIPVRISSLGTPVCAAVEPALHFGPEVIVIAAEHLHWFSELGRNVGGAIKYRGDPGLGVLELDDFNVNGVQIFFSGHITSWDPDNEELTVQGLSDCALHHQRNGIVPIRSEIVIPGKGWRVCRIETLEPVGYQDQVAVSNLQAKPVRRVLKAQNMATQEAMCIYRYLSKQKAFALQM